MSVGEAAESEDYSNCFGVMREERYRAVCSAHIASAAEM